MILMYGSQREYDAMAGKGGEGPAWSAEDFGAMHEFMRAWNQELVESGEFVDAQGLTAPVHARRIRLRDGVPVVTDGPYPETEEVLAGYTIVECDGFDRATEIAARVAACPNPGGRWAEAFVDVRPIVDSGAELGF
ncbi:YciI family protein [Sphaerisporangium corydalis]|uniref:YciI family protein n=1 Tax=Sphaerisporangium corydalis TaxID=1441875 RepID=A0ABV9EE99_9ACTN|nr:YciI family protein [Sphaerisporangium corydalis]